MEGRYKGSVKGIPQHGLDPLFHLVRRFVGEGDAENVGRRNTVFVYQIRIPVGQRPGLAGAGARNDADIPFGGGDRFDLGLVQVFKKIWHDSLRCELDICSFIIT